ncbi:hypothetical protein PIB30_098615 [Stylosanthes scabra]|nr:hypothetical protein [Stylosanthes scabra]
MEKPQNFEISFPSDGLLRRREFIPDFMEKILIVRSGEGRSYGSNTVEEKLKDVDGLGVMMSFFSGIEALIFVL